MGLGINRDYKTRDRKIKENLVKHNKRMVELTEQGYNKQRASEIAFKELLLGKLK